MYKKFTKAASIACSVVYKYISLNCSSTTNMSTTNWRPAPNEELWPETTVSSHPVTFILADASSQH